MLLQGVFAAITTPFYSNESVYLRKLEANVARYSRSLLSGLLVLGSTGECVLLDEAESRDVLRVTSETAAPDKVLIAGVGQQSLKATVEMSEVAARYQYDVVLVRTPTFYRTQMSPSAVMNYFRSVADRSPLPVLLYNIPSCVHYDLPVELIAELAQHPNIIGVKDSSGNLDRLTATVEATRSAPMRTVAVTPVFEAFTTRMASPERGGADARATEALVSIGNLSRVPAVGLAPQHTADKASTAVKIRSKEVGFQVLTGSTWNLLPALEAGATGAVLGSASFIPQALTEIYLAWKEHDLKLAAEKQERVVAVGQRIPAELGIPAIKYACDFNGYYGGFPRAPLLPVPAEQRVEIEELLRNIRN